MFLENAAMLISSNLRFIAIPMIWLGIVIISLIVETQTANFVSIWFAPGAFVALILSFFRYKFYVQGIVFIGITLIGMILSFAVIRPILNKRDFVVPTNIDALPGHMAQVIEHVDNYLPSGVVKINGQLWTARMADSDETATIGEWVEIVRVEGSKLICRIKSE